MGLQEVVSQWHARMSRTSGRRQGMYDGKAMHQGVREEHWSVTAYLRIVARLECGGDFACLPAESATTDRAALAVRAR